MICCLVEHAHIFGSLYSAPERICKTSAPERTKLIKNNWVLRCCLVHGSLYYQLQQCFFVGKSLKINIHLYCLIPLLWNMFPPFLGTQVHMLEPSVLCFPKKSDSTTSLAEKKHEQETPNKASGQISSRPHEPSFGPPISVTLKKGKWDPLFQGNLGW